MMEKNVQKIEPINISQDVQSILDALSSKLYKERDLSLPFPNCISMSEGDTVLCAFVRVKDASDPFGRWHAKSPAATTNEKDEIIADQASEIARLRKLAYQHDKSDPFGRIPMKEKLAIANAKLLALQSQTWFRSLPSQSAKESEVFESLTQAVADLAAPMSYVEVLARLGEDYERLEADCGRQLQDIDKYDLAGDESAVSNKEEISEWLLRCQRAQARNFASLKAVYADGATAGTFNAESLSRIKGEYEKFAALSTCQQSEQLKDSPMDITKKMLR